MFNVKHYFILSKNIFAKEIDSKQIDFSNTVLLSEVLIDFF